MGFDLETRRRVSRFALWAAVLGIAALMVLSFFRSPVEQSGGGSGPAVVPDGYRAEAYSAPTPTHVPGARTVGTDEAKRLWTGKTAVFIDTQPIPGDGDPARRNIPGSYWLPDIGYGTMEEETFSYLRATLFDITQGDKNHMVIFYCRVDCWLSWNAAKRGVGLGYRNVLWYPQGTDGWREHKLPLADGDPLLPF